MTTVTLGKTGLVSPKNAFGALPLQRVTDSYAVMLLQKAYRAGITFYDTAHAYSDSEHKIGLAFGEKSIRETIILATKTGAQTVDRFWNDLHMSLERMKTDYIDIYQFHNPACCPKPGDGSGLYEAMCEAKEKGMIRHIGITNHRLHVAAEAVESGLYETLQFPLCYLATEKDLALVTLCREHNVGFIAMKALSGGLITKSNAAYAYLNQFDNVLPIWGIQRESELDEFLSYMENEPAMTDDITALIAADREQLLGDFCRGCGYCMPCPVGIEINNCARMAQLIRRSPSANWLTPENQKKMLLIDACLHCNACMEKCPYGLDTPALLARNLEDYKNILAGNVRL